MRPPVGREKSVRDCPRDSVRATALTSGSMPNEQEYLQNHHLPTYLLVTPGAAVISNGHSRKRQYPVMLNEHLVLLPSPLHLVWSMASSTSVWGPPWIRKQSWSLNASIFVHLEECESSEYASAILKKETVICSTRRVGVGTWGFRGQGGIGDMSEAPAFMFVSDVIGTTTSTEDTEDH